MIRLIFEAFVALVVEETVRRSLPKYLHLCWMVIAGIITIEMLYSEQGKSISLSMAIMTGKNVPLSYFVVALMGAAVFISYWWGIQQTLRRVDIEAAPPPHAPRQEKACRG